MSSTYFFTVSSSRVFEGIAVDDGNKVIDKTPFNKQQVQLIESYMISDKPHLNCVLNLDNLAEQLKLSPRLLSNIINQYFKHNFFEFINSYRVEESRRLLSDPANSSLTMLDIMDKSGFNSKATFNTFFKKTSGMTPSQYKATQLKK